jgi:hypothetical protein
MAFKHWNDFELSDYEQMQKELTELRAFKETASKPPTKPDPGAAYKLPLEDFKKHLVEKTGNLVNQEAMREMEAWYVANPKT